MNNLDNLILEDLPAPTAVEFDSEARAVYVRFTNAKVSRTVADDQPGVITAVDLDAKNQVVGVEIVGMESFSFKSIRQALPEPMRNLNLEEAELKPAPILVS